MHPSAPEGRAHSRRHTGTEVATSKLRRNQKYQHNTSRHIHGQEHTPTNLQLKTQSTVDIDAHDRKQRPTGQFGLQVLAFHVQADHVQGAPDNTAQQVAVAQAGAVRRKLHKLVQRVVPEEQAEGTAVLADLAHCRAEKNGHNRRSDMRPQKGDASSMV